MQTSLPELPFTNYGKAELRPSGTHSTAKSTPRTYHRTDLQTLTPWTSFPDDIHQAIQSATARADLSSTPFPIDAWTKTSFVENEGLRAHARFALHEPVQMVLEKLGVKGWFTLPGGGNVAIVGAPDFSWIMSPTQLHPKVIVRVPVTTCLLVVKPRWCRLNTKLGGWWNWSMLLLLSMALVVTRSANNPWIYDLQQQQIWYPYQLAACLVPAPR
jgi:hypothetical protein